jgi:hypothetical protein
LRARREHRQRSKAVGVHAELDAAVGEGVAASTQRPLRSEWDVSDKGTASNDDLATKEFALILYVVAPRVLCRLLVLRLSSSRTPPRTVRTLAIALTPEDVSCLATIVSSVIGRLTLLDTGSSPSNGWKPFFYLFEP